MQIQAKPPEKKLLEILPKNSGRNNAGQITVRHQGGRHKRFYRLVDFRRDKKDVKGKVVALEYDPNRNVNIALVFYPDGDKRYILAPLGLKVDDQVLTSNEAEITAGNVLPLKYIPVGTPVHNLELIPGKGGKMVRAAGSVATILAKEEKYTHVKFPSGEVRKINCDCLATIGQLGNENWRTQKIGTAGRARRMGLRPEVRGVAQNPRTHPHGGGEGRSGIGMKSPKSPWGKRTLGKKTRNRKKYSNSFILQRRK